MTGKMLAALERIITEERPDLVLVPGDTNSSLAGALAAAKQDVPIAHLEAGLRSFNRRMPEEINRVLTDHLSTLLLCPTETAVVNLRREGIIDRVHNIGDVMYDAACFATALLSGHKSSTGWVLSSALTLSPRCIGPKAQKAKLHSLRSWSSCAGRHAIESSYSRSTLGHASGSRSGASISATYWRASRSVISTCTGSCDRRLPSSPIPAVYRRKPISTKFLA